MRRVWLLIFLLAMFITGYYLPAMDAEEMASLPVRGVAVLSNRDYFPVVHQIFQDAESSIRVMMFSARYYTEKPRFAPQDLEHIPGTHWSSTNVLLDDLVAAKKRGVEVSVILDNSTWNESNTELNTNFGKLLAEEGVMVYLDDPEVTTHTKLILVDDDLSVVGSTNWSYYALDINNETSVLIQSSEINQIYRDYYTEVLANSAPLSLTEGD
jgi:cardiolipin synthase